MEEEGTKLDYEIKSEPEDVSDNSNSEGFQIFPLFSPGGIDEGGSSFGDGDSNPLADPLGDLDPGDEAFVLSSEEESGSSEDDLPKAQGTTPSSRVTRRKGPIETRNCTLVERSLEAKERKAEADRARRLRFTEEQKKRKSSANALAARKRRARMTEEERMARRKRETEKARERWNNLTEEEKMQKRRQNAEAKRRRFTNDAENLREKWAKSRKDRIKRAALAAPPLETRERFIKTFEKMSVNDKHRRNIQNALTTKEEKSIYNRKRGIRMSKEVLDAAGLDQQTWNRFFFFKCQGDWQGQRVKTKLLKESLDLELRETVPEKDPPHWVSNWGVEEWKAFMNSPESAEPLASNEELDEERVRDWVAAQVAGESGGDKEEQRMHRDLRVKEVRERRQEELEKAWKKARKNWVIEAPDGEAAEKRKQLDEERQKMWEAVEEQRPQLAMACCQSLAVRRLLLSKETHEARTQRLEKEKEEVRKAIKKKLDSYLARLPAEEKQQNEIEQIESEKEKEEENKKEAPKLDAKETKAVNALKARVMRKMEYREYDLFMDVLEALSFPTPAREKDEKGGDLTRFVPPASENQLPPPASFIGRLEALLRKGNNPDTITFWTVYQPGHAGKNVHTEISAYRDLIGSFLKGGFSPGDYEENKTNKDWWGYWENRLKPGESQTGEAVEVEMTLVEAEALKTLILKGGEKIMALLSNKRWYVNNKAKEFLLGGGGPGASQKGTERYEKMLANCRRKWHLKKRGVDIGMGNYWNRHEQTVVSEKMGRGGFPLRDRVGEEQPKTKKAPIPKQSRNRKERPGPNRYLPRTGEFRKNKEETVENGNGSMVILPEPPGDVAPLPEKEITVGSSTPSHSYGTRRSSRGQPQAPFVGQEQGNYFQPQLPTTNQTQAQYSEDMDWLPFATYQQANQLYSQHQQPNYWAQQYSMLGMPQLQPVPTMGMGASGSSGGFAAMPPSLQYEPPQPQNNFLTIPQLVPEQSNPSIDNTSLSTPEPSYQDDNDDWDEEFPPPSSPEAEEEEYPQATRRRSRKANIDSDEDWHEEAEATPSTSKRLRIRNDYEPLSAPSSCSSRGRGRPKGAKNKGPSKPRGRGPSLPYSSSGTRRRNAWLLYNKDKESLFPNKQDLLRPRKSKKEPANPLACPLARNPVTLRDSKLLENVAKLLPKCPICSEVFPDDKSMALHSKRRHGDGVVKKVEKTQKKDLALPSRKRKKNDGNVSESCCKLCGDKLKTEVLIDGLQHFFWKHYETGAYLCPFRTKGKYHSCAKDQKFNRHGLLRHFNYTHKNEVDMKTSWVMGISDTRNLAGKSKFLCLFCPQGTGEFSTFEALKAHYEETHEKERFPCETCGLCVRTSDHLLDHQRIFHQQSPFTSKDPVTLSRSEMSRCLTCDSEFISPSFLSEHEKNGHFQLLEDPNPAFFCKQFCGKTFTTKQECEKHAKMASCKTSKNDDGDAGCNYSHTPYKCELCKCSFLTLFLLRHHTVKRHGLSDYLKRLKEQGTTLQPLSDPGIVNTEQSDSAIKDNTETATEPETTGVSEAEAACIKETLSIEKPARTPLAKEQTKLRGEVILEDEECMTCSLCGERTLSLHTIHRNFERARKRYCYLCDRIFSRPTVLRMHNEAAHSIPMEDHQDPEPWGSFNPTDERDIKCPVCVSTRYFTPAQFHEMHSLSSRFDDNHKCEYCGKIFNSRDTYRHHIHKDHGAPVNTKMQTTQPARQDPFRLAAKDRAPLDLTEEDYNKLTASIILPDKTTIFSCRVCLKNYQTREFLRTHISTSHEKDAFTRVMCPDCNATFGTKNVFQRHWRHQHSPQAKIFGCYLCTTHLTRRAQVSNHFANLHPGLAPDFTRIRRVARKDVKDDKRKLFFCEICNRGCGTEQHLKSHMTSKHFPTHYTSFCQFCGLQMGPNEIKKHERFVHQDKMENVESADKVKAKEKVPKSSTSQAPNEKKIKYKRLGLMEVLEVIEETFGENAFFQPGKPRIRKSTKKVKKEKNINESEEEEEMMSSESEDESEDMDEAIPQTSREKRPRNGKLGIIRSSARKLVERSKNDTKKRNHEVDAKVEEEETDKIENQLTKSKRRKQTENISRKAVKKPVEEKDSLQKRRISTRKSASSGERRRENEGRTRSGRLVKGKTSFVEVSEEEGDEVEEEVSPPSQKKRRTLEREKKYVFDKIPVLCLERCDAPKRKETEQVIEGLEVKIEPDEIADDWEAFEVLPIQGEMDGWQDDFHPSPSQEDAEPLEIPEATSPNSNPQNVNDDVEEFVNFFKRRRKELGFAQNDVGFQIESGCGYGDIQSCLSRFEGLKLRKDKMLKLLPFLQKWLGSVDPTYTCPKEAEEAVATFERTTPKKRVVFDPETREMLENYFKEEPHPAPDKLTSIAESTKLDRDVVKIWFANRRQSLRKQKGGVDVPKK